MQRKKLAFALSAYAFWAICLLLASACGQSKFAQKFNEAADIQNGLDSLTLPLWQRSPTADTGTADKPKLTADDDLCSIVPRRGLALRDVVDIKKPLRSKDLLVYKGYFQKVVKSFWDYLVGKADCLSDDFQVPHTFAHTRIALDYLSNLYTSSKFPSVVVSSATKPLTVYANEDATELRKIWLAALSDAAKRAQLDSEFNKNESDADASVFSTHYDPLLVTTRFYRDLDGVDGKLKYFNAGQEADAIYHETCHHFQAALNATYLKTFSADAAGSLLEGLADFCAAAIVRDDKILSYFQSNAPALLGPSNLNGASQIRRLDHTLKFPDNYTGEIHLDGRIVAGALNDFRRFLAGETVNVPNASCSGTACNVEISSLDPLSAARAWDEVLRLAYMAFYMHTNTDTLYGYANLLKQELSDATKCNGRYANFCNDETREMLNDILAARGLIPPNIVTAPVAADITVDATLGFIRLPLAGYSNFDNYAVISANPRTIFPCETLMVFPVVRNRTGTAARATKVSLAYGSVSNALLDNWKSTTGAFSKFELQDTDYLEGKGTVLDFFVLLSPFKTDTKMTGKLVDLSLPWLEPGEDSQSLIGLTPTRTVLNANGTVSFLPQSPSRIYSKSLGSVFTQPLSGDFSQIPVGWLVQMPQDSTPIKINYSLYSAAFNSRQGAATSLGAYSSTLATSSSNKTFCSN